MSTKYKTGAELLQDERIAAMKRAGGGSIAVSPEVAAEWAHMLEETGATVTCVLGCDWPRAPGETET